MNVRQLRWSRSQKDDLRAGSRIVTERATMVGKLVADVIAAIMVMD